MVYLQATDLYIDHYTIIMLAFEYFIGLIIVNKNQLNKAWRYAKTFQNNAFLNQCLRAPVRLRLRRLSAARLVIDILYTAFCHVRIF